MLYEAIISYYKNSSKKNDQSPPEESEEALSNERDSTVEQTKETLCSLKFYQDRTKMIQIISSSKTQEFHYTATGT